MSRREIPDFVRLRQAQASDPSAAVFVAAHAGSGKTHVLAQRVVRLMLDGGAGGVDPSKILCITFTKAAAANMAARVYATLKDWIARDDAALDAALREIGVTEIDAGKRARARRLFAAALETPGGLKVQTIHGFCAGILRQFPFEANVAARFTVLEDRQQSEMLERAILAVLLDAAAAPESPLGLALKVAVTSAADSTFRELLREAADWRDKLRRWLEAAGSLDAAVAQLSAALGVAPGDRRDAVEKEIVEGPHLPVSEWASIAALCGTGSSNDQEQCERLKAALAAEGAERIFSYLQVFFNVSDNKPRKSCITAPLAKKYPDLAERFTQELARLLTLVARRNALICRDRTAALLAVAVPAIGRYTAEKERRGYIDFDDLIDKTYELMWRVHPSWVHYKLDLGLDHVLIDEAQDTSEKQWGIIAQLVAEFAAGAGARGLLRRTIFAVGDEKQSIFSFQGAAPRHYETMRRHFQKAYAISEVTWRDVHLDFSFRSGENVLGAVDEVFKPEAIARSVTADLAGVLAHRALPDAVPGLVEIWPLIEPDAVPQPEAWDAPFDELPRTSPQQKLAQKIAATVRDLVAAGTPVGAKREPMRYGDVLVLVRQRGPLFEAIIRALKNAGIAVAGADRLELTEHIAVVDLMALADALLLPQDDLALATALKSPLFGFDDDRLFALAWQRRGSLRAALAARAGEAADFGAVDTLLRRAAARARSSPFEFFAWLLGPEQGRRKIFARLGLEAADALDEFLELALDYERNETPSLQGFLVWLRAATSQVKRDMEVTRNEVRVMTVHGAKGLEARVVILADTTTRPEGAHPPRLLEVPPRRAPPGAPPCIAWAGRKIDDCAALAAARAAALAENENEHRRLLYVAMTRAAERLIVAGYRGGKGKPAGCWYDLVFGGLSGKPGFEEIGTGDTRLWRYCKPAAAQAQGSKTTPTLQLSLPFALATQAPRAVAAPQPIVQQDVAIDGAAQSPPAWLTEPAPAQARLPTALSPSRAQEVQEEITHAAASGAHGAAATGPPPRAVAEALAAASATPAAAALSSPKSAPTHVPPRRRPAHLSAPEVERAMLRGVLFHRLMQSLPDVPAAQREEVGHQYLARAGVAFSAEERGRFLAQALAVFADARFAPLFGPGSRAEVPIIGRLARPGRPEIPVSGQIDRLMVTAEEVLIGDYKTNRDPPRDIAAAPRGYVDQLAIYRGVLARIYSDRPIRCVLVWTEIPDLMEFSAATLDEALEAIRTSPLPGWSLD
jgi:ATP-dependent helicase/nuclease subunit A